jgi:hypothetical protein
MTGERPTRPHRQAGRRLSNFTVRGPLQVDALDNLTVRKMERIEVPREDATLEDLRAFCRRLALEMRDKEYTE